jgi:hypothetical protein
MAVRIKVGGVDRGDFRDAKSSLTWQDQVNGRGTLAVTFRSRFGEWRPEDGQEISVERDDTESLRTSDGQALVTSDGDAIGTGPTRLFGGILLEPSEREEVGSGGIVAPATVQEPVLVYECQASEYSCICDRRIVAAIYEQMTLGDIVRDLLENYLDGEGINSWGVVAAGPLVEKAIFADVTVTQALNQVCELTGYVWRVDQFRVMQVQPWEGAAAPVAIDGAMLIAGTVKVRPSR